MPIFGKRKIKATKEEFALVLSTLLKMRLSHEQLNETAELFNFDISKKRNFERLFNELYKLNMWIITHSCERIFDDVDKRNECLDIFHKKVHQAYNEAVREQVGFDDWVIDMVAKYSEYNDALKSDQPPGSLWALATVLSIGIFGKLNLDVFVHTALGEYIATGIKATESALKQYKVS